MADKIKKSRKIFLTGLFIIFLACNKSFAASVVGDLLLSSGNSYILSFNEDITRYNVENKGLIEIEPLTSIFNGKKEIIIRSLADTSTLLSVWTSNKTYKFNIFTGKKDIGHCSEKLPDNVTCIKLDNPPYLENSLFIDFKFDKPPGVK